MASARKLSPRSRKQLKPEIYSRVDDEATIILTYPKAQAIVQASWNWPFGRKDMEVYGQTGYAITVAQRHSRAPAGRKAEEQVAAKPVAAPYDNDFRISERWFSTEPKRTLLIARHQCDGHRDPGRSAAFGGRRRKIRIHLGSELQSEGRIRLRARTSASC